MQPLSPFETAYQFLRSNPQSNDPVIQDKLEKMWESVNECNSQDSNFNTLSEHRKGMLERRVIHLFKEIQGILHPAPKLRPEEIYKQQVVSLKSLTQSIRQLSPIEFHKELKKLDPDLKRKIYEIVWIASGCPKENHFSEWHLKIDPSILTKQLPSIAGNPPGTLLEQVEADLQIDFQLTHNHPDSKQMIDSKVKFFQACLADSRNNHTHMKAIFKFMHPAVKNALNGININPPFYGRGVNFEAWRTFGPHYNGYQGRTTFQVYAPNAIKIVLNLTAFGRTQHAIEMKKGNDGVWSAETYDAKPGRSYHYMITGKNGGQPIKKVDPFAFSNLIHDPDAKRENHESMVVDIDKEYPWTDGAWIGNRHNHNFSKQPLNIYEIHSSSWVFTQDGKTLNWRDLAQRLAGYCKDNGYNGIELMAMFSHPQPISMGYQITNFFAPNSEMGSWEDFQYFVDYMHNVDLGGGRRGICVFADWVPAHFAIDEFALCNFDGTPIFEDDNSSYAYSEGWGTYFFDFKKQFTNDFLASNADFILRKLHIDGLRVDAVTSMLLPNKFLPPHIPKRYNRRGTEVDLAARVFFRHLNTHIRKQFPGVITMSEESEGFANITRPAYQKGEHIKSYGLGFDFTWHMGFMSDTLEFWKKNALERKDFFQLFVNSAQIIDGHSDIRPRGKVILPYSHDENATGKLTILGKMSGSNREEKFANGRLALAYQLLRGGGPSLDFQGNNFLQSNEWHGYIKQNTEKRPGEKPRPSVQWEELNPAVDKLEHHLHSGAAACRKDLNELALNNPGLWDQTDSGFSWIAATDSANCVMSFHRRGNGQQFACIFNTSDADVIDYMIELPGSSYAPELTKLKGVREVYNTDDVRYGGKGRTNTAVDIIRDGSNQPTHFKLHLPPYAAIVLEEQFSS